MSELDRWVHRLQQELGLDPGLEVDIGGLLDLARVAAHEVDRPAAPLTTFLVGYAAGRASADSTSVEALAARATALAESWAALNERGE
jgi:hypothetical protein